jgi:hypothetical protein
LRVRALRAALQIGGSTARAVRADVTVVVTGGAYTGETAGAGSKVVEARGEPTS